MKRLVVGAHYGLRDWMAQRVTAVLMTIYILGLAFVILWQKPAAYEAWRDLFAQGWMRIATLLFVFSLAWHAWVGARDILMDYVKPTGARLSLEILTLLLLAIYIGWTAQILWR